MSVYAVSNPVYTGRKPKVLYDRATGYGIVRFKKSTRDITIECWPRWSDPSKQNPEQYPGWPIVINQLDNYNRDAKGYLPFIKVQGIDNPVIQVIDELNNEIVYTLCMNGSTFKPKVFHSGAYTLKIGDKNSNFFKSFSKLYSKKELSFRDTLRVSSN